MTQYYNSDSYFNLTIMLNYSSLFFKFRYYGGWLAPRIYYLGSAGVINVGGIRIGGISGFTPSIYANTNRLYNYFFSSVLANILTA